MLDRIVQPRAISSVSLAPGVQPVLVLPFFFRRINHAGNMAGPGENKPLRPTEQVVQLEHGFGWSNVVFHAGLDVDGNRHGTQVERSPEELELPLLRQGILLVHAAEIIQ